MLLQEQIFELLSKQAEWGKVAADVEFVTIRECFYSTFILRAKLLLLFAYFQLCIY